MKPKTVSQMAAFFLLIHVAAGGLNYDVISYAPWAQVKIGDDFVFSYYQSTDDYQLEQEAWAGDGLGASEFSCGAWGRWNERRRVDDSTIVGKPVDARASITVTFQPHGNQLEIYGWGGTYEPSYGALYYYELTNKTTGEKIGDPSGLYAINPDHIYELYLYAGTTLASPDMLYNGAEVHVDFAVLPEPATLLLLGFGGLVFRCKQRTK